MTIGFRLKAMMLCAKTLGEVGEERCDAGVATA
jgi:hypothetical protein